MISPSCVARGGGPATFCLARAGAPTRITSAEEASSARVPLGLARWGIDDCLAFARGRCDRSIALSVVDARRATVSASRSGERCLAIALTAPRESRDGAARSLEGRLAFRPARAGALAELFPRRLARDSARARARACVAGASRARDDERRHGQRSEDRANGEAGRPGVHTGSECNGRARAIFIDIRVRARQVRRRVRAW